MEQVETWANLAMNHGMSLLITVYFLWRDWKYQETLITLLGTLSSAIDQLKQGVNMILIEKGGDTE